MKSDLFLFFICVSFVLFGTSSFAAFDFAPAPQTAPGPAVSAPVPQVVERTSPTPSARAPRPPRDVAIAAPAPIAKSNKQNSATVTPMVLTPLSVQPSVQIKGTGQKPTILTPHPKEMPLAKPSKAKLVIDANPLATKTATPFVAQNAPVAPAEKGGVVGFGKDIPLGLALHQIVPSHYGYSFGPGAAEKMGQRVSWDGKGRSWDVVAKEMVEPLGLKLTIGVDAVTLESTP